MHWGHTVSTREKGKVEVTRTELNEAFGIETPEQPSTPDAVAHVWDWWNQLSAHRTPGFEGVAPLLYSEIAAWIQLLKIQITPSEIKLLIMMDEAYLQTIAEERKEQRIREKAK